MVRRLLVKARRAPRKLLLEAREGELYYVLAIGCGNLEARNDI